MKFPDFGKLVADGIERENKKKVLAEIASLLALFGKHHGPEALEKLLAELAATGGQVLLDVRSFKQSKTVIDKWR